MLDSRGQLRGPSWLHASTYSLPPRCATSWRHWQVQRPTWDPMALETVHPSVGVWLVRGWGQDPNWTRDHGHILESLLKAPKNSSGLHMTIRISLRSGLRVLHRPHAAHHSLTTNCLQMRQWLCSSTTMQSVGPPSNMWPMTTLASWQQAGNPVRCMGRGLGHKGGDRKAWLKQWGAGGV